MIYASIDMGTNTIRLLIAKKIYDCSFDFIYQKSKIARIGEGFGKIKKIKTSALQRTLSILEEYKKAIKQYNAEYVFVGATSAIREATNKDWFIKNIKRFGFDVEIITSDKEARLTHLGIVYSINDILNNQHWMAFDLGGGSTEFMFSCGNRLLHSFSIPLGGVKLLEMFVKNDPPTIKELNLISTYFMQQFQQYLKKIPKTDFIVGNAGTVTSLAAIDMNLETYSFLKTEKYMLKRENIEKILLSLLSMNAKNRLETYRVLEKGREDVIVVGAEIVKSILNFFDKHYIIATNGSLREGMLIDKVCN